MDYIEVAIKVRPLIKREKNDELGEQWIFENNRIAQIDPLTQIKGETEFCFDHVFDQGARNVVVYRATVKRVVEASMRGFNVTIFAYDQTSSCKTYTMMGTTDEPGVIPLSISSIFHHITQENTPEFVLSVSYLEIYNF